MQYRQLGNTGQKVSALGFGCMRLPTTDGLGGANVDKAEAVRMIQRGIDGGINYLDTALVYHAGVSEKVIAEALKNGYRERHGGVLIATKLPTWDSAALESPDKILNAQLKTLGVDCIDVYFLHCLQVHTWRECERLKLPEWLDKKKREGKIRYAAFSFHDAYSTFTEVVDAFAWDVAQIQYNYMGENVQAGKRGLQYAAGKGIAVIAMEPLFGGVLADPPGPLGEQFKVAKKDPVDIALRWVWNQPEISLLLSGMTTMEHVERNLEIADSSGVAAMTDEDLVFVETVQKTFSDMMPIACSKCRYCDGCPVGVDIATNFEAYNNAKILSGNTSLSRNLYGMMAPEHRASACTDCGLCETKCPQQLPIRSLLKDVSKFLGGK
ncbi:MAG: aldo/keto reductase [Thermoguttaceae bacterium]